MIDEAEDESMLYEDDNSFSAGVVVGRRNALQDVMDLIESKKDQNFKKFRDFMSWDYKEKANEHYKKMDKDYKNFILECFQESEVLNDLNNLNNQG